MIGIMVCIISINTNVRMCLKEHQEYSRKKKRFAIWTSKNLHRKVEHSGISGGIRSGGVCSDLQWCAWIGPSELSNRVTAEGTLCIGAVHRHEQSTEFISPSSFFLYSLSLFFFYRKRMLSLVSCYPSSKCPFMSPINKAKKNNNKRKYIQICGLQIYMYILYI